MLFFFAILLLSVLYGTYRIIVLVKEKRRQKRLEAINTLFPEVEAAFNDIAGSFNYGHYLTESERKYIDAMYSDLKKEVNPLVGSKEMLESEHQECFTRFNNAMSDTKAHKAENNERFKEKQLAMCKEYFDSVMTYPLDEQQRDAIVTLEDNVLVISSAGSGKTMTTVGKVRYLIDVQKVNPEKILLITFTRKAAESLSERVGDKQVKCRTFHKLALEIIGEATGKKPSITEQDFSVQVYHKLMQEDSSYKNDIIDYLNRSRYKGKSQFEYSSMEEYMQDRQKHGIQTSYNDMDGKPIFCKSDEESQICDFLGYRGVKFRYEEKYEKEAFDANHRQYTPDFSIYVTDSDGKTKRLYLEHYGINKEGRCPSWYSAEDEQKYLEGIKWKRYTHAINDTVLLETTSADFQSGEIWKKLTRLLYSHGVVYDTSKQQSASHELQKQEENILNMLTSFNFLLKSRNLKIEEISRLAINPSERFIIDVIIAPFVNAYNKMEEELGEIDFTDAINQAADLCNNGHRPDYDYILVDEFQDISEDRYRFLDSLKRKEPLTKLFCVGDDWQSIYRFAGSDMALFKHFEKYFGYTKKCFMETTYRFGEPAIAMSSKFILANPEQAEKHVRPFNENAETWLDFESTRGAEGVAEAIKQIADEIPADKEIMLLGRYSFDVNILKKTDLAVRQGTDGPYVTYGKRKMKFMTVHQSKGLECDYIILMNCNGGTLGFPADIADNPVLRFVLSEPDGYDFSEERRLFYVGITRAKKHTWVLYDENNPSVFIREFVDMPERNKVERKEDIPEECRCPKCHCGRIIVTKKGKAVNGNPYSVQVCSNARYGCDYLETVFINLNAKHYTSKRRKVGF